jgi:perosamine synthetase
MIKIETSTIMVTKDQTIRQAMQAINEGSVGACIVVEQDHRYYGLITDGDIRRALLSGAELNDQIQTITNQNSVTAREGDDYNTILSQMSQKVRHIPILDPQSQVKDFIYFAVRQSIPIARPTLEGNELKYVTECVAGNWISSKGKYVVKFEQEFADYCGCKYGLAVSNGTAALHLSLATLGITQGDEVLIPSLTFIATANAVAYTGAKPVFIDSEIDTWNIDPLQLEAAITPMTKAIIPVHLYGQPVKMKMVMDLAHRHGLYVIEDAAEAHGAEVMGTKVGSIGDMGCFSFFGNKIITTGEGGMLITNNKSFYDKAKILRDHGMSPHKKYWHDQIGFNYRMTNIQAAIGCAQVEKIESILEEKLRIAETYKKYLSGLRSIILAPENEWSQNVFWMYAIILDIQGKDNAQIREHVLGALDEAGIESRPFFYPIHIMPPYQSTLTLPIAEKLSQCGLVLPSYTEIQDDEIEKVCQVIIQEISRLSMPQKIRSMEREQETFRLPNKGEHQKRSS